MGIYADAVEKFGMKRQVRKAFCELTEMSLALQHYLENKASVNDVCSEIADVEIMCLQMRVIFGNDKVDDWKLKKIEKLKRLVSGNHTTDVERYIKKGDWP